MKHFMFLLLISALASGYVMAQQADTVEWTVLMGGDKAGFIKQWKNADGSFSEWTQYNDRGRGDSTVSVVRYDDEGYITYIEAKGVDYYKKPVYEKFRMENGTASWENNSEKETRTLQQKAAYIPLKISVGTTYEPYFQSNNNTIHLLPTGQSKLTVLKEHQLEGGVKIRLVSIVGAGLTPSYSWIDEDNQFFAYPGDWFAMIKKGYEHLNKELDDIQKEYKERYFKDLAKALTGKYENGLAITNATLFDPKAGEKRPGTSILIKDGQIVEVSTAKIVIPDGYQVIDAQNKFVMPGMWDMHVHLGDASSGLLHVACGVTNVRDMGNGKSLLDLKADIDNGTTIGPRIQTMSGFIDGAGPYTGPIGAKINTVEEGKAAIKEYAEAGYQQIKLYSSIKPEWVMPLAEEAKKYNLRVSGHIPAYMTAEEAVLAGYNEIQHSNMLFLNFYGKDLDTRTPLRFTTVAEKAASFDFDSEEFKAFAGLLKEKNITLDPTVTIFEGMFIGEEGKTNPSYASITHRLPPNFQRNLKSGSGLAIPEGLEETYRNSFLNLLKMVKVLHDQGITIVPGTDAFAGFAYHRELENYVRAGIPNAEVLKMATLTSAEVLNKADRYGSIEKGKAADLIIVDGDPTAHIEDIRKVELIVKDKDMYYAKDLLEKISIKHFK